MRGKLAELRTYAGIRHTGAWSLTTSSRAADGRFMGGQLTARPLGHYLTLIGILTWATPGVTGRYAADSFPSR